MTTHYVTAGDKVINRDAIDVYPVGILQDAVLPTRRALNPHAQPLTLAQRYHVIRSATRSIRRSWRRRSAWNGYLAEPTWTGGWTRCGHGWTKRRALADLAHHLTGADQ